MINFSLEMNCKEIDCLILIEHTDRELSIAKKLKSELEKRDTSAFIANLYLELYSYTRLFNPKVIVVPFFYSEQDPISGYLLKKFPNSFFVSLDFEQISYPLNAKRKKIVGKIAKKNIYRTAWSQEREIDLQRQGVPKNKILNVVNPKLSESVSNSKISQSNLKISNILFIENYQFAFYSENKMQKVAKIAGLSEESIKSIKKIQQTCLKNNLFLLNKFANENPNIKVSFRVRPNLTTDLFNSVLMTLAAKKPDNFLFVKEGHLGEDIEKADLCLTNFSTGIIESIFNSKKSAILRTIPYPKLLNYEWDEEVIKISDLENVLNTSLQNQIIKNNHKFKANLIKKFLKGRNNLEDEILKLCPERRVEKEIDISKLKFIYIKLIFILKLHHSYSSITRKFNNIPYSKITHSKDQKVFLTKDNLIK